MFTRRRPGFLHVAFSLIILTSWASAKVRATFPPATAAILPAPTEVGALAPRRRMSSERLLGGIGSRAPHVVPIAPYFLHRLFLYGFTFLFLGGPHLRHISVRIQYSGFIFATLM